MSDYAPRGEGTGDSGWVRIGRWDRARRRSTWARLEMREGPLYWVIEEDMVEAVELCSGREGDDAYVRVDRSCPCFSGLVDVVMYAIGNVPNEDESQGTSNDKEDCR